MHHPLPKRRFDKIHLNRWHVRHGDYIRERTYARTDPDNPKARAEHAWWWTHERLRRTYFRIIAMRRDGMLFAYLEQGGDPPSNTNRLEGGVNNADLKRKLDAHRGLSPEQTKRCCEWGVYMKSANPDPKRFVVPDCWNEPKPIPRPVREPAPRNMDPDATTLRRTRHPRTKIRHQKRLGRTLMTRRIRHTFCHLTRKICMQHNSF